MRRMALILSSAVNGRAAGLPTQRMPPFDDRRTAEVFSCPPLVVRRQGSRPSLHTRAVFIVLGAARRSGDVLLVCCDVIVRLCSGKASVVCVSCEKMSA